MSYHFRKWRFLPLQMRQQPDGATPGFNPGSDDQTLASVVRQPDIAGAALRQAGEFPPSGRKLGLPFGGNGDGIKVSHTCNNSLLSRPCQTRLRHGRANGAGA